MLKTMKRKDIDKIFERIVETGQGPEGINRSYLWEIHNLIFSNVYYSIEAGKIKDVIYNYTINDEHILEEWSGSKNILDTMKTISESLGGKVSISLTDEKIGNTLGLQKIDENKEMRIVVTDVSNEGSFTSISEKNKEEAIKLMMEDWYPGSMADSFVNTIMENTYSITNVLLRDNNVVGLAHSCYEGDRAWMNALYIGNKYRGQGGGKELILGIIEELKKTGVKYLFLGVDNSNSSAIRLYSGIGFKFTRFKKYQFIFSP